MNNPTIDLQKKYSIRPPYHVMLIIAAVLAAYYPANFGELCRVDDLQMVKHVGGLDTWSLKDVFIPRTQHGLYYRPIVQISFLFDRFFLNLNVNLMHLESIIYHLINSLLVYWLASMLLPNEKRDASHIPLVAGLLFGLHPINTESVNWISARTDVLAALFILLSANFLILFKRQHAYFFLLLSFVTISFGLLSKEVSIAFLPGAFLILSQKSGISNKPVPTNSTKPQGKSYGWALRMLFGMGAIAVFYVLRSNAFVTNMDRMAYTIKFISSDVPYYSLVFLKSITFYMKKILFPFPLNFAILDVDPVYELFIVPLLLFCLYIYLKRDMLSGIFISGVILIMPALIIATGEIAWTSFAERYMYLPVPFIIIFVVFTVNDFILKLHFKYLPQRLVIAFLIVIMGIITFQRSIIWMNNVSLFQDTVGKSPTFHSAHAELAYALVQRGELENARAHFIKANQEHALRVPSPIFTPFYGGKIGYWDYADIGLAYLLERKGNLIGAAKAFEEIYVKSREKSQLSFIRLMLIYEQILIKNDSPTIVEQIKNKLMFYDKQIVISENGPYIIYRLGKAFLMIGDKSTALRYFRKAYEKFDNGDDYKIFAQKLVKKLEKKS